MNNCLNEEDAHGSRLGALDLKRHVFMHSIPWLPTAVVVLAAAVIDIQERRIPNWLVAPFAIGGCTVWAFRGGVHGLEQSLLGFGIGAAVMGVFYLLGGLGMGDVKLCAGVGAWIGPHQITTALVFTALSGGIMALLWAAKSGCLKQSLRGTRDLIAGFLRGSSRSRPDLLLTHKDSRKMPYAPAIAIGTIFSFLASR